MARNRNVTPAIPFIQLCDEDGGLSITAIGVFHTWDTQSFKTSNFHYNLDSDRVYIKKNSAGYYEITFDCSFGTNTNDTIDIDTQIYKNGIAVDNSVTRVTASAAGQIPTYYASQTLHFILFLEKGDYVQIKSTASANSVSTIGETSRLIIRFIPMEGWNNSHAGREQQSGGVLR